MLDPRRILTFREVARLGSFSRAAQALSLSQPAVSQQVAWLERRVGAALLVRGPGGTALTPAGRLLFAHAESLAARLDLAGSQLAALVTDMRDTLRIGAFPSAMATVVPAAIGTVRAGRPGLEVEIEERTGADLVHSVQTGRLHAALCFQDATTPRREHDGLVRHDLAEDPMVALLPADHRLAGRRRIDLCELADEPWMAPEPEGLLVRACRTAGFEPRVVIHTRDPLAARAIAAAGLAVSLTPRLMAGVGLPGVATPALTEPAPRRDLYLLVPAVGAHPIVDAFTRALATAFE